MVKAMTGLWMLWLVVLWLAIHVASGANGATTGAGRPCSDACTSCCGRGGPTCNLRSSALK